MLFRSGLDAHVGGFADILAYEMQWPFGEYLRRHGAPAVGPRIRELLARARDLSQRDYVRRLAERHRWRTTMDRWLSRYDAVVTLASSGPAPPRPPPDGKPDVSLLRLLDGPPVVVGAAPARLARPPRRRAADRAHGQRPRPLRTGQLALSDRTRTTDMTSGVFDLHAIMARFPAQADTMLVDTRISDEAAASAREIGRAHV